MTMTNEVCLESCTAHNKPDQLAIEQLPIVHTLLHHYEIAMNQTHCIKVVIVDLLWAGYDLMSCQFYMNVLFGRCSSQIHRLSHHKRARTVCTSTQYKSAPIAQVQHPSSVLDKNILPLWLWSQHGGIFVDFFEVECAYTVSH
jgi:hypothetical protein